MSEPHGRLIACELYIVWFATCCLLKIDIARAFLAACIVTIILIMGAAQSTPGAPATGAPGAVPLIQITLNLADVLQGLSLPVQQALTQQAGTAVPAGGGDVPAGGGDDTGGSAPPAGMPAPPFPPEPPAPAPAEQYLRVCQKCGERSYIREKVCLNEWCQAWNCCEC